MEELTVISAGLEDFDSLNALSLANLALDNIWSRNLSNLNFLAELKKLKQLFLGAIFKWNGKNFISLIQDFDGVPLRGSSLILLSLSKAVAADFTGALPRLEYLRLNLIRPDIDLSPLTGKKLKKLVLNGIAPAVRQPDCRADSVEYNTRQSVDFERDSLLY